MSQSTSQFPRVENPLHQAQIGPPRLGDTSPSTSILSPPKTSVETQNPLRYMTFFGVDETSMTSPGPNTTSHRMASSTDSECPYDSHFLGVGPQVEYSDPQTSKEDGNTDSMFDFYPDAPWNHWPVAARTINESGEGGHHHPAPQFGLVPTVPGMTNFEPMMTTYETHGGFSTQETPESPSQSRTTASTRSPYSGSVATFSRKNSSHQPVHSPAASAVQPTPLEFRFETVSPGAWKSSPTRQAAGQFPGDKEKTYSADTSTTTTTVEVLADSPEDAATSSPTANSRAAETDPKPAGPGTEPDEPAPATSQRQRNRAAATKCRRKSKVAIAQLEATGRALSDRHSELSATVTGLREEVLALKNEILLHGNCDSEIIQHYLTNAARSLSETIMAAGQQQQQQQQNPRLRAAHDGA